MIIDHLSLSACLLKYSSFTTRVMWHHMPQIKFSSIFNTNTKKSFTQKTKSHTKMAVFTIVTTFADAVVASKRVNTSSSVLTRAVETFVKIYNSNNRAKNNVLFVCLFVYCSFFVRTLRGTKLLQISVTGSFQLTNLFSFIVLWTCFCSKLINSIVGYGMIAYPTFQIVSTLIGQLHNDDIWLQLTEFTAVLLCYLNLSMPLRIKEQ